MSTTQRRAKGRGSVFEYRTRAGKRWRIRVTVNGTTVVRQGFTSRRAADDAIAALRESVESGDVARLAPTPTTMSEMLADAIESLARVRDWKPRTVDIYEHHARLIASTVLGGMNPAKVERRDVEKAYRDLADRGYSSATLSGVHTLLGQACAEAVYNGAMPRNPVTSMKAARGADRFTSRTVKTWTPEQARAFLDGTTGDRLHIAWVLALACGLRRSELSGLRWGDIDLDGATLSVRRQMDPSCKATHAPVVVPPKSEDSVRDIDLDASTVDALRRWHAQITGERDALGIGKVPDSAWVLGTPAMRGAPVVYRRAVREGGSSSRHAPDPVARPASHEREPAAVRWGAADCCR